MVRSTGTILLLLLFLLPAYPFAQEADHMGSYHSVYIEIPIAEKWSFFSDDELRGIQVFNKYYYYELKAGLNYKYSKRFTFSLAAGVYKTFHGGEEYDNMEEKTDYKLWQQINYKQPFFSGALEHRMRVEQVVNHHLQPAVRYRLQPKWPLNKQKLTAGALFATAYGELFFQFRAPALSRNRLFGGLGYYFSDNINMQTGIIRQTDFKRSTPNFAKHFLYLSGSFRL